MDKIKNIFQKPITAGVIGLIIGLIIGLPVLGWGVWPVKWKDADASYLRQDLKAQYMCMIVDSYKVNNDAALAAARLDSMGISTADAPFALDQMPATGGCSYNSSSETIMNLKAALAGVPSTTSGTNPQTNLTLPTSSTGSTTPEKSGNKTSDLLLLMFLLLLFIGIGVVLYFRFFSSKKKPSEKVPPSGEMLDFENPLEEEQVDQPSTQPTKNAQAAATVSAPQGDIPAAHFITTYVIGDDMYDDSFSIDTAKGELLGECGVGISDTVGVGEPRKISAFEVWLFDKNVTQTVTKVLMSSRAMNAQATLQRLSSRGEPVLVEPGQEIILETPSLQLQAKVIEMVYGQGAMPQGSYFERLTLELSVWAK
jgi:hypothetical protein